MCYFHIDNSCSRDRNIIVNFTDSKMKISYLFAFIALVSSTKHNRKSVPYSDHTYKTGVWSSLEDAAVIKLHASFTLNSTQNIWVKISKTIGRRPKLIREHYHAKLSPNLHAKPSDFTDSEDRMYREYAETARQDGVPIKWSQLARDMHRARLIVYFHYAKDSKRYTSSCDKDDETDVSTEMESEESDNINTATLDIQSPSIGPLKTSNSSTCFQSSVFRRMSPRIKNMVNQMTRLVPPVKLGPIELPSATQSYSSKLKKHFALSPKTKDNPESSLVMPPIKADNINWNDKTINEDLPIDLIDTQVDTSIQERDLKSSIQTHQDDLSLSPDSIEDYYFDEYARNQMSIETDYELDDILSELAFIFGE